MHQEWTPNWKIDRWEEMTRTIECHIQLLGGTFVFNWIGKIVEKVCGTQTFVFMTRLANSLLAKNDAWTIDKESIIVQWYVATIYTQVSDWTYDRFLLNVDPVTIGCSTMHASYAMVGRNLQRWRAIYSRWENRICQHAVSWRELVFFLALLKNEG